MPELSPVLRKYLQPFYKLSIFELLSRIATVMLVIFIYSVVRYLNPRMKHFMLRHFFCLYVSVNVGKL